MHSNDMGIGTMLAHLGEEEKIKGAVVPPIFQNSLFLFDTCDELLNSMLDNPEGPPHHYSRLGNPTVELAETKIAALEGAERCKLVGSGQGALTLAILSATASGAHVIAPDTTYGPVRSLLKETMERFGVSHTLVDGRNPEDFLDAIRPETTLIYLESPSSILFRIQDVEAITREAMHRGITTVSDNTYNTPLHHNPLAHGVDIVCHSATKYLAGHSDITAGAICTTKERMDGIVRHELNYLGSILHPFSAWLLTRGLRTLELRLKRHEQTANILAEWIEQRPEVEQVHHVSLSSFAQHDLYAQYLRGSGGLFSFVPKTQEPAKLKAFCDRLKLFGRGVSWGGFESLALPLSVNALGTPKDHWVIRLFCGLEEPVDLILDLEQAFVEL